MRRLFAVLLALTLAQPAAAASTARQEYLLHAICRGDGAGVVVYRARYWDEAAGYRVFCGGDIDLRYRDWISASGSAHDSISSFYVGGDIDLRVQFFRDIFEVSLGVYRAGQWRLDLSASSTWNDQASSIRIYRVEVA